MTDVTSEIHLPTIDHLIPIIPIIDFARQGDVIVIPSRLRRSAAVATTVVGADGVAVVSGEYGGHTHLLTASGDVRFDRSDGDDPTEVGVVRVAPGAIAYLLHPEHGGIGFREGEYTIRRQREWDGHIRVVWD